MYFGISGTGYLIVQHSAIIEGRKIAETKGIQVAPALADRDDPDTTIYWQYDDDGNVSAQTKEDGTQLVFTYDGGHRLTAIDVVDRATSVVGTTSQTFTYDGLGRPA